MINFLYLKKYLNKGNLQTQITSAYEQTHCFILNKYKRKRNAHDKATSNLSAFFLADIGVRIYIAYSKRTFWLFSGTYVEYVMRYTDI